MNLDKIKARIARALALADSAGDTPEGHTARATAQTIAAKYGLDITRIKPVNEIKENAEQRIVAAPPGVWRSVLAWGVAKYAGVELLRSGGRESQTFYVIGMPSDIDLWRALYFRAERDIEAEVEARPHLRGKGPRDSFRKGAAQGFGDRLARYRAESQQSAQGQATSAALARGSASRAPDVASTALVMVGRQNAVAAKLKELYPKVGKGRGYSTSDWSARREGVAYGQSMGVHRGEVS